MKQTAIYQGSKRSTADTNNMFIVLGLKAKDPGYRQLVKAVMALGDVAHFNEGLLYLTTECSIDEAFKQINKSTIDSRIASDVSLVLLDPGHGHAKWYLNRGLSEMLHNFWDSKTNLFVCCAENKKLTNDIRALGTAASISESIWYVSSNYSPKEAYQILSSCLESEDRLTVFDATGRVKSWQAEWSVVHDRPTRATIHHPATMFAEHL